MEQRIKFHRGEQKKFLNQVIINLNCVSLRGVLQFGFNIPYSTIKNYYLERRLMPKNLFKNLCHIAKINSNKLNIKFIEGNWGQIKGGKIRKRK